ncbi:DUF3576 domain-containing protein [Allosediminivita pacifica]|uniref:Uncharacterized protein DUF3576 n=1 Tax=Allosediminivita pacifica TaxID=1267769 RepID=A0A2T6B7S6_9RHOB|nr:DUF3576 domain-containing protein [Allosediminivita pacifica]PTX52088.1 uncharacterized protein DUF3576 [Allosediminivita pacifica]GGA97240.1 hypothetical protein GCM10011324_04390 [Allosediminivita pacifica]
MPLPRQITGIGLCAALALLAGCSGSGNTDPVDTPPADEILDDLKYGDGPRPNGTIWDYFRERGDPGQVGAVNRYIWNASLETLNFLPIETVDPFTGVISTGFGTPPGGGQAYRATIYVTDPALDARSLNIALMTRSGPAPRETVLAVEDAILTRARQLRQRDSNL